MPAKKELEDIIETSLLDSFMDFIAIDDYKTCLESLPISTVDIVIFNSDLTLTLLFLRKNEPAKSIYYTIGGRLRKNEKIIDCAIRVMKSEIGLEISENELLYSGVVEEFFSVSIFPGIPAHNINFFYAYKANSDIEKKLKLDDQHTDFKWFPVQDKNLHSYIQEKIQFSLDTLKRGDDNDIIF